MSFKVKCCLSEMKEKHDGVTGFFSSCLVRNQLSALHLTDLFLHTAGQLSELQLICFFHADTKDKFSVLKIFTAAETQIALLWKLGE